MVKNDGGLGCGPRKIASITKMMTNHHRRLTRNLERSTDAAENLVEIANLKCVFTP
jgi:hypothetical protein